MKIEVYKRYFGDGLYEYTVTTPFYITQARADGILCKDCDLDAKWVRVKDGANKNEATITFYSVCSYDQEEIEDAFRYCDEAKGAKIKHMAYLENFDWTKERDFKRGFDMGVDRTADKAVTVLASMIYPVKIIQNGPATIIFWKDGKKTVVKRKRGDKNDIDAAVAQAIAKRFYGSNSRFHRAVELAAKEGKGEKK